MRHLRNLFPLNNPNRIIVDGCKESHPIHIHLLHDGAFKMQCFICPYDFILLPDEGERLEKALKAQNVLTEI